MKAFSIAGRLDFGGFRVAAVWKHHEDVRTHSHGSAGGAVQTSARSLDGDIVDVGARYTFGANAVSLGWRSGEMEAEKALAGDETDDAAMLGYRRTLGPGVSWKASLIWADYEADGPKSTTARSNDGWAVTSSVVLVF